MIKNIYFKHIPPLDAVSTKSLIVDSHICSWFCTSQCESLTEEKQQKHFCLESIFKLVVLLCFFVGERVWLRKAAGAFLLLSLGSIFASGRVQNDNSESFFMLAVANKLTKFYLNKKDKGCPCKIVQFCKINNNLIDPWI